MSEQPRARAEAQAEPQVEPRPERPAPLSTGVESVDALLGRLGDTAALPTGEHGALYEDVHSGLRGVLAALDDDEAPVPGPAEG